MKQYISLLMIGMLVFSMMASVSCDRTETPVKPTGHDSSEAELQAKLAEMEKYDQEFFALVDRIDPYVSTNKDQTWTVDWDAFTAANSDLTAAETKLLSELKQGLPLANAAVLEGLARAPAEAQSSWTNYYWWGKRECYTGSSADWAIYWLRVGGASMTLWSKLLGFAAQAFLSLLDYLKSQCGGFCLYRTWFGAAWVTCP